MPKGTKPTPPQQANLNEFWGKPKPKSKKKAEGPPVASGSGSKKDDAGSMQVDEPSHRDPQSTRPSQQQSITIVELTQPKLRVPLRTVRTVKYGHTLRLTLELIRTPFS